MDGADSNSRTLFTTEAGKRLLLASNRFPPGSDRLESAIARFRATASKTAGLQDAP